MNILLRVALSMSLIFLSDCLKAQNTCTPSLSGGGLSFNQSCGASVAESMPTATSNCCPGNLEVQTFVAETGAATANCNLTPALGPGNDWAVWLPNLGAPSAYWFFDGPATLEQYADGSAKITGVIHNSINSNLKLQSEFWLDNARNWNQWSALGRYYKDDLGLSGNNHIDWTYYELVADFSRFTGIGQLAGTQLSMSHMPANYFYGFQLGNSANNRNTNPGLSGWFYYSGNYNGNAVSGHGDINVNTECSEIDNPCASTQYTQFIRVEDNCGGVYFSQETYSFTDNSAPIITLDSDTIQALCFSVNDSYATFTDDCSEVQWNAQDEVVVQGCPGVIRRTYTATDGCGNSSQAEQIILTSSPGVPVFIDFPADLQYPCNVAIDELWPLFTYTEPCPNTTLSTSTQIILGECPANYQEIVTYTLTDDCGNEVSEVRNIYHFDNGAPVMSGINTFSVVCGEPLPMVAPVTYDDCSEYTLTYSDESVSQSCGSQVIRTWTATDACGNASEFIQTIQIVDSSSPTFTFVPENINLSCGATSADAVATAVDNCSEVTITSYDETSGEGCNTVILRHWVATDACGNSAEAIQTISFQDNEPPVFTSVPADENIYCGTAPAVSEEAIAIDNCSAVTVTFEDVTVAEGCGGSILRTWTATDACGNIATATQTISFVDYEAPVVTFLPGDLTVSCDNVPTVDASTLQYYDNCSNVDVQYSEVRENGYCPSSYVLYRSWVLTDACGNSSIATWTIYVIDETPPVMAGIPADTQINCGESLQFPDITATDNCSATQDIIINVEVEEIPAACGNIIRRIWTATDACLNTSSQEQIITVVDTQAPEFTFVPADGSFNCSNGATDNSVATAVDNCSDVTVISYDELLGVGCDGGIRRHWLAIDACGNSAEAIQNISYQDNEAPTFTFVPASSIISCGTTVETVETAVAQDNCSEVSVTYQDATVAGGCAGSIVRTWIATDGCGNVATATQTITITDDQAPVVTSLPEDLTASCDNVPVAGPNSIQYTDNCGQVDVQYNEVREDGYCPSSYILYRTWTLTDACGNSTQATWTVYVIDETPPVLSGVPADVQVSCGDIVPLPEITATDNCGNDISITLEIDEIPQECGRIIRRIWTATDACLNTSSSEQIITVSDNIAPVLQGYVPEITLSCGSEIPMNVTATDNCGDVFFFYADEPVAGSCGGDILRIYRATDACGNQVMESQLIHFVDDVAPVFTSVPADVVLSCGSDNIPQQSATASDNCGDVSITYFDIDVAGGCDGDLERHWVAQDECGNSAEAIQMISVQDNVPPTFTSFPEDLTASCSAVPDAFDALVGVSDNCSSVGLSFNEVREDGYCAGSYILYRTWTAVDGCGNATSSTWSVYVIDETPPVLSGVPADTELSCGASIPEVNISASDNCSDGSNVTITLETSEIPFGTGYILRRTWTAADECFNTSTETQDILFIDNTGPIIQNVPADITIECGSAIPAIAEVSATDACSQVVQLTAFESEETIGCTTYLTRRWFALDANDNISSEVQVITILDTEAPVLSATPADITILCGQPIPAAPAITASDACAGNIQVDFTQTTVSNTAACGSLIREWCATDCAGNQTCHQQNITVITSGQSPEVTTGGVIETYRQAMDVFISTITPAETGQWQVELLDIQGRLLDKLYEGTITPDAPQRIEWSTSRYAGQMFIVRCAGDNGIFYSKVIR